MSLRCQKVQIMHSLMQCPLKPNADEKKFDTKLLLNPWKEVELFANPFPFAQWSIYWSLPETTYGKQTVRNQYKSIQWCFFFFLSINESSGWPLIIWSLYKSISDFPRLFLVWESAPLSNQHAEKRVVTFRKQDNGGSKAQKPDWKEIFSGWSCMTGLQRLMSFGHLQHICTFYMSLHKFHQWLLGSPGNK